MNSIITFVGLTLLLILVAIFAIGIPDDKFKPYTAGEILYPDYAHTDTLIVVDPVGLNKAIAADEELTDWTIATALYQHCAVLGQRMDEYSFSIDTAGYTLTDRYYKETIKVKWGTNFDSLLYNWND